MVSSMQSRTVNITDAVKPPEGRSLEAHEEEQKPKGNGSVCSVDGHVYLN